MGDKDLKKCVEKICNWVKSINLTGISTPLGGLTWDTKEKRKFDASFKLRVFIGSIANDKYDESREVLKQEIESTGLANVYLSNSKVTIDSNVNNHIWRVEDSDVCIFIIDNRDGVIAEVQDEINIANRNNIKSIYYFCSQFTNQKTSLEKNFIDSGTIEYNEVSSFSELVDRGTQNVIDEIVATY